MKVFDLTGILLQVQCLFYCNKLICSTYPLKSVPDQANVFLKIRGIGGRNICFGQGELFCADCKQYMCTECSKRVHHHPKRSHQNPTSALATENPSSSGCSTEESDNEDEYNMDLSPSLESSFRDAELIADKFGLTSFKKLQQTVIEACVEGKDSMVLHPTGSGKSLCFQFLPVHLRKKGITSTISSMQDQIEKLNSLGIK